MTRTLRSKRLRAALWMAADGKCQVCGDPLGDDWHADHIVPWSVRNETNLFDMQALCKACNITKGAKMELRDKCDVAHKLLAQIFAHQDKLRKMQLLNARLLHGLIDGFAAGQWPELARPGLVVNEIVPGGGKSYIGVMYPSVLVGSDIFDAALWFVPRTSLCFQARDDFGSREFALPTGRNFNPFNPADLKATTLRNTADKDKLWDRRNKVFLLSYQMATRSNNYAVILEFVKSRRVLCIYDEFQLIRECMARKEMVESDSDEAGDKWAEWASDSWADYVTPIVNACEQRTGFSGIILSGGLYRHDGKKLPFVKYRNADMYNNEDDKRQYAVGDVIYTLKQAQEDECLIKIDFDLYNGQVEFNNIDGEATEEKVEALTDSQYGSKLQHFIETQDVWQSILGNMLTSIDAYNRNLSYHSRYLVIAHSISQAEIYFRWMCENEGRKPLLIHSENKESHRNLERFRKRQGDWDGLITIGMAYIGLNVKDLSHLAYLSKIRSVAWMNQAFHRITRFDSASRIPYRYQLARICAPNDPQMVDISNKILNSQNPGVRDLIWEPLPPRRGPVEGKLFDGTDAFITGRDFNTNGEAVQHADIVEYIIDEFPDANQVARIVVEKIADSARKWSG